MPDEPHDSDVLGVHCLPHPQGCRAYLLVDADSQEALALDVHLDQARDVAHLLESRALRLRWIVDSHTHADHPSAAATLARQHAATRVVHPRAGHAGAGHLPGDGDTLELGDASITVRHAPGHTPDHMALLSVGSLFSGDSRFIGGVARADFIGGDAGTLYDSIHDVMLTLPDETVLYPGHDYAGRTSSTIGAERESNPWLKIDDRDRFVASLEANPPPEPANMAALLRFNREGSEMPPYVSAREAMEIVEHGGAGTIIDVRTTDEIRAAHVPGSRHIAMDEILHRVEDVLKTPAPRLILCRTGPRAMMVRQALAQHGVGGLSVVEGGILAYARAGGEVAGGDLGEASDGGGCCAAAPP